MYFILDFIHLIFLMSLFFRNSAHNQNGGIWKTKREWIWNFEGKSNLQLSPNIEIWVIPLNWVCEFIFLNIKSSKNVNVLVSAFASWSVKPCNIQRFHGFPPQSLNAESFHFCKDLVPGSKLNLKSIDNTHGWSQTSRKHRSYFLYLYCLCTK